MLLLISVGILTYISRQLAHAQVFNRTLQNFAAIWLSGRFPGRTILKVSFKGSLVNAFSPEANAVFSSNAFNHWKTQHKLCTGMGISKSLHVGSRSKDARYYQVSSTHTHQEEFPQRNSPQRQWRALQPQNIPICVLKAVKNDFFAPLLNSCNKTSSY